MGRGAIFDPQEFRAGPLFTIGRRTYTARMVIDALSPCLTEARLARIAAVAAGRTRTIVPVTEGLYDRGNVSAVVRSAEALGYQCVHVIDNAKHYKEARRVTQGAEKWVDVLEWPDTGPCLAALKAQGYRLAVAHLEGAVPLRELDPAAKTALLLGNEHAGPSAEALAAADVRVVIPMSGFTQSFNISVAAALCLYALRERREAVFGAHGDLSATEQEELVAAFCLRSVPCAAEILARST